MPAGSEFHGGPRSGGAEPEARGPERNARRDVRRVSTTAIFFRK